jgi:hypothetical protein
MTGDLICTHPANRLAHDPETLRVYCSRCYGSLTPPLPSPLTYGEMERVGLGDLLQRIFDEPPTEEDGCVVFDRLMADINRNLERTR